MRGHGPLSKACRALATAASAHFAAFENAHFFMGRQLILACEEGEHH
jgi:hypothetical protein